MSNPRAPNTPFYLASLRIYLYHLLDATSNMLPPLDEEEVVGGGNLSAGSESGRFYDTLDDLKLAVVLGEEANISPFYFSPLLPLDVLSELDTSKLGDMMATRKAARPQPKCEIIFITALAMQYSVVLRKENVDLVRRCLTRASLPKRISDNLRAALRQYDPLGSGGWDFGAKEILDRLGEMDPTTRAEINALLVRSISSASPSIRKHLMAELSDRFPCLEREVYNCVGSNRPETVHAQRVHQQFVIERQLNTGLQNGQDTDVEMADVGINISPTNSLQATVQQLSIRTNPTGKNEDTSEVTTAQPDTDQASSRIYYSIFGPFHKGSRVQSSPVLLEAFGRILYNGRHADEQCTKERDRPE